MEWNLLVGVVALLVSSIGTFVLFRIIKATGKSALGYGIVACLMWIGMGLVVVSTRIPDSSQHIDPVVVFQLTPEDERHLQDLLQEHRHIQGREILAPTPVVPKRYTM